VDRTRSWVVARRVLVVLPVVPWLLAYGVVGVALLVLALRGFAWGEVTVRVGTDSNLGTWQCLGLGVWGVLAFAVLVAAVVLLVLGRRDARWWVPVIGTALVLLAASIGYVAAMEADPGESTVIWAVGCWPTAAVPALLVGRRLELVAGGTF
jgi:hypothetical protein